MKFFMTSEMDSNVTGKVKFGQNSIEDKIKKIISDKNYGRGVSYWGHIIICMEEHIYEAGFFKEIKKYMKKNTEVELRLRVDYDAMFRANEREASNLIINSVLRGIDVAETELKITDFDFSAFRKDLTDLFKKEGWL